MYDSNKPRGPVESLGARRRRPPLVVLVLVGAALLGIIGVSVGLQWPKSPPRIRSTAQSTRLAGAVAKHRTAADDNSYAAEGVALSPPPPSYVPPESADAALASFKQQNVPQDVLGSLIGSAPNISLYLVTENEPIYPGISPGDQYPAWVITYTGVPALSSSPISSDPLPSGTTCSFIGIFDLQNSAWTNYFEDTCS